MIKGENYSTNRSIINSAKAQLLMRRADDHQNRFFKSSITNLPGPTIGLRGAQVETGSPEAGRRMEGSTSTKDDTVSVSALRSVKSDSTFKNKLVAPYGGKFSPENIPDLRLAMRKTGSPAKIN